MMAFGCLPEAELSGYGALRSNACIRRSSSSDCSIARPSRPVLCCVVRGDPAPPDESSWLIRLYVPDRSDYRFRWHLGVSLRLSSRDIEERACLRQSA